MLNRPPKTARKLRKIERQQLRVDWGEAKEAVNVPRPAAIDQSIAEYNSRLQPKIEASWLSPPQAIHSPEKHDLRATRRISKPIW